MTEEVPRLVLLWSGGKDAMMALQALETNDRYEIVALLTTVIEGKDRVSTHGTPLCLIKAQAESLGLDLEVMRVPLTASNQTYESAFERALASLKARGVQVVATGDLHLQDVRDYRVSLHRRLGVSSVFPIWGYDPKALAVDVANRMSVVVTSVDTQQLDASFAGRIYDRSFLERLPPHIDPCGENGEFHTFVSLAPEFSKAVPVQVGDPYGSGRMRYARLEMASSRSDVDPASEDRRDVAKE